MVTTSLVTITRGRFSSRRWHQSLNCGDLRKRRLKRVGKLLKVCFHSPHVCEQVLTYVFISYATFYYRYVSIGWKMSTTDGRPLCSQLLFTFFAKRNLRNTFQCMCSKGVLTRLCIDCIHFNHSRTVPFIYTQTPSSQNAAHAFKSSVHYIPQRVAFIYPQTHSGAVRDWGL